MSDKDFSSLKAVFVGALGATAVFSPAMAQAQQQVAQASGPVTSISQLSDVQPTDWAFQALQSLVERYGCIAGYPDRTYRGNRAMTRFEFAAGMNACLDRINELIAAGLADKVSREDLATLQRLQEEFAAELAALKGRVDVLEGDVAELQGQVFNPVTKLRFELYTALTGSALTDDRDVDSDGIIDIESDSANMILPYRLRMIFDASFTGNDRLRVRLQARDANTEFFAGDPGFDFSGGGGGDVVLDDLFYQFRVLDGNLLVFTGLNSVDADQVFAYNVPWDEFSNFSDTPKSTQDAVDGAALGFRYDLSEQFSLAYAYTADDPQDPGDAGDPNTSGNTGIFGGESGHYVEVGFTPVDTLGLYFQFGSSYTPDANDIDFLSDGEALFLGPQGLGAGFGDAFARVNAFTFATNWEITPRVIFSGWVTFGEVEYTSNNSNRAIPLNADLGSEDINGWLAGFLFPDLFLEGASGQVTFGQPIVGTDFVDERPFVLDFAYGIPINDFLTLTPGAYFVFNPNGSPVNDNDPTIGVGALQARFSY